MGGEMAIEFSLIARTMNPSPNLKTRSIKRNGYDLKNQGDFLFLVAAGAPKMEAFLCLSMERTTAGESIHENQ
jgi:hypothetical protein